LKTNIKQNKKKTVTLKTFIDNNDKLLSALGIFTALTVFSSNLSPKYIGYVLSFLFLSTTILLWLELWARFPSKFATTRLIWFENILSYSIMAVIAYWLIAFYEIWRLFLFLPIALILLYLFSIFIKHFSIFNIVFYAKSIRHKILRYILGCIVLIVVLYISFYIANQLASPINTLINNIKQNLE
jgi:hypothetical protein